MSDIWTFSPTSQALLQRCIDAAAPPDEDNKWYRHFRQKPSNTEDLSDVNVNNSVYKNHGTVPPLLDKEKERIDVVLDAEIDDNFLENLETEPVVRYDCFVEKSLKNPKLITAVAEKLPMSAIEKLSNHLFNQEVINTEFLQHFYQYFFPAYLKREYSWFSLNLLVKAEKTYPVEFKKLLHVLLKDVEIPNKVLYDFMLTLNTGSKSEFLINLVEIELNCQEFIHNLLTIYTVYKDCKKNDKIQAYIKENLFQYSEQCATEKNYGHLLLAYLQSQEGLIEEYGKFKRIVNTHRTPFKKPCQMVLQENLNKFNK